MPTEDLKDDVFHDFDPNSLKYGTDELDGRLRGVTRHLGCNMATLFALKKQLHPSRPPTTSIFKGSENKKKDLHEISWFFRTKRPRCSKKNGSNFHRTVFDFSCGEYRSETTGVLAVLDVDTYKPTKACYERQ